jgi:cysteinyl-tRNA synthetase
MMEINKDFENNFDTVSAIKKIMKLIDVGNIFSTNYAVSLLIYDNIMSILNMLGFRFDEQNKKDNEIKLIKIIENTRNKIREYAKTNKQKELFLITDEIRTDLSKIGVDFTDDKK